MSLLSTPKTCAIKIPGTLRLNFQGNEEGEKAQSAKVFMRFVFSLRLLIRGRERGKKSFSADKLNHAAKGKKLIQAANLIRVTFHRPVSPHQFELHNFVIAPSRHNQISMTQIARQGIQNRGIIYTSF